MLSPFKESKIQGCNHQRVHEAMAYGDTAMSVKVSARLRFLAVKKDSTNFVILQEMTGFLSIVSKLDKCTDIFKG